MSLTKNESTLRHDSSCPAEEGQLYRPAPVECGADGKLERKKYIACVVVFASIGQSVSIRKESRK
jgi:hypothetical protein